MKVTHLWREFGHKEAQQDAPDKPE